MRPSRELRAHLRRARLARDLGHGLTAEDIRAALEADHDEAAYERAEAIGLETAWAAVLAIVAVVALIARRG